MESLDELREWIAEDEALASLQVRVEASLGDDPGHDLGHLLRVALWTVRLAEDGVDRRAAVAASLLHDLVSPAKDSPENASASERSAEAARRLLPALGFDAVAVDEIAQAIEDHSYSRGATPRSPLGRALQDADRLDALGALGVFRALVCGVRMGSELFDACDPWAENRELDDKRFTVDHFFTKLLNLAQTMNTEAGRREAAARVEFMRRYLEQLGYEIGRELP